MKIVKRIGISIVMTGLVGVTICLLPDIAAAQSIGEWLALTLVMCLLTMIGVLLIELW